MDSLKDDRIPYCSLNKIAKKWFIEKDHIPKDAYKLVKSCLDWLNSIVYDWLSSYVTKLAKSSTINVKKLAKAIKKRIRRALNRKDDNSDNLLRKGVDHCTKLIESNIKEKEIFKDPQVYVTKIRT